MFLDKIKYVAIILSFVVLLLLVIVIGFAVIYWSIENGNIFIANYEICVAIVLIYFIVKGMRLFISDTKK